MPSSDPRPVSRRPSGDLRQAAAGARTWLFVPGDAGPRLVKAHDSAADEVVIDLEDAVGPSAKEQAREAAYRFLDSGRAAWVRVNASGTTWFREDVTVLAGVPGLRGLVVPKADDPAAVGALREQLGRGRGLVGLVETAIGMHRVHEIAAAGVDRLAFGALDYAADLGCSTQADVLLPARTTLVLASRVAGIAAPIDGVTTAIDGDTVRAEATLARDLGYTGKLCIHPRQITPAQDGLAPTDVQLDWARRVLEAASGGAVTTVDGEMVDAPVVARARSILRG